MKIAHLVILQPCQRTVHGFYWVCFRSEFIWRAHGGLVYTFCFALNVIRFHYVPNKHFIEGFTMCTATQYLSSQNICWTSVPSVLLVVGNGVFAKWKDSPLAAERRQPGGASAPAAGALCLGYPARPVGPKGHLEAGCRRGPPVRLFCPPRANLSGWEPPAGRVGRCPEWPSPGARGEAFGDPVLSPLACRPHSSRCPCFGSCFPQAPQSPGRSACVLLACDALPRPSHLCVPQVLPFFTASLPSQYF